MEDDKRTTPCKYLTSISLNPNVGGGGRGRSWLRHPRIENHLLLEGQVQ